MSRILSRLAHAGSANVTVNNLFGTSLISRAGAKSFSSKTAVVTVPKAAQNKYLSLAGDPKIIHHFPIFDQETVAQGAAELKSFLSRQARVEGCKDSDLIIKALEGFANAQYNSIYFTNSVPKHESRAPNLRINAAKNVASDTQLDSDYPQELITENFPNFLFLAHCLGICGLRAHDSSTSTKVRPFTILNLSNAQPPHCDGVSSTYGVDAISLSAISSKGETATFTIDLEYILSKLSPETIETLLTTIFRAQGQFGEGFHNSKDIRILEQGADGKITINYNPSLACTMESWQISQAMAELHGAISSGFEKCVSKFYLKTGESLFLGNKRLVHGRAASATAQQSTDEWPNQKPERTLGVSIYTAARRR